METLSPEVTAKIERARHLLKTLRYGPGVYEIWKYTGDNPEEWDALVLVGGCYPAAPGYIKLGQINHAGTYRPYPLYPNSPAYPAPKE